MTEERPRRLSESSRVEAFSDGVFSIAITLLVLELAIPAVNGKFAEELAGEWVSYVAYLAAFGSIGVLWMGHHTAFSRIRAIDAGSLWRNLVLLLTVSVVPFPTAVIASAFRVGYEQRPGGRRRRICRRRAWRQASPGCCCSAIFAATRTWSIPHTDVQFFRLTEPLLTLVGYGISALIGWFVSPPAALAIFLVFPAVYVVRVRSAAR